MKRGGKNGKDRGRSVHTRSRSDSEEDVRTIRSDPRDNEQMEDEVLDSLTSPS